MKSVLSTMLLCCFSVALLFAQTTTLTFTGRIVSNQYVPLSRVVVSNLTKGWQETLLWPDTVLMMSATGIQDVETQCIASLQASQNNPNPFDGTTFVNLQVVESGDVAVEMTDIAGRIVGAKHFSALQPGIYPMRVTLSSPGLYFLTARQNGQTTSIKMVNRGGGGGNDISFAGIVGPKNVSPLPQPKNAHRSITENPFDLGDQMEYVGFAMLNGIEEESGHKTHELNASQTIELSFPNTHPCHSNPTVTDIEGNVYNTVQIGDQCWMRESLRTTMFADSAPIPMGFLYSEPGPHYYNDSTSYIPLEERGYLYDWAAAMHEASPSNAVPSGVQGICPDGWHLPSDTEWMILLDHVRGQPEYNCAGNPLATSKALSSPSWWNSFTMECCPGNQNLYPNNATGFRAVPTGTYWTYGYEDTGISASFWTSTDFVEIDGIVCYYGIDHDTHEMLRGLCDTDHRFSVRCLKD